MTMVFYLVFSSKLVSVGYISVRSFSFQALVHIRVGVVLKQLSGVLTYVTK